MNIKIPALILLSISLISCGKPQYTANEHLQRAESYQQNGQLKAAIIELKNALQLDSKNADTRIRLAQLYLQIEDGSSAEKELTKANEYGADLKEHSTILARTFLLQRKFNEITGLREPTAGSATKKADFHALKAEAYLALDKPVQAKSELELAEKIDPKNTSLIISKAKLAIYNSKYDLALDYLQHAPEDNIPALFLSGKVLTFKKEYDKASTYFLKLLKISSKNIVNTYSFESHVSLSYIYIDKGEFDKATTHIKSIEEINQNLFISKYLRANIAYKKGDYSAANDFLLESQKINPDFLPAHLLLGSVNYVMGFYNQAQMYLEKVLSNDPQNIAARKILGLTKMKLGNAKDALVTFKAAEKLDQNDAELLAMMGSAALRSGNLSSGRTYLRKALSSGIHDNKQIKSNIAASYIVEGNYNKAIDILKKIDSDQLSESSILLIKAHLKKGDYKSALKTLQKIADGKPETSEIKFLYGVIYLEKGNISLATKYIKDSLNIKPDNILANYLLAKIYINKQAYTEAEHHLNKILSVNEKFIPALIELAQIAAINNQDKKITDFLSRAISIDSSAIYPRLILTRYYLATHRLDDAFSAISELEKIASTNPSVLTLKADIFSARNNNNKAINIYKKLSASNDSPEIQVKIANAYLKLGDIEHARQSLKSALKLRKEYFPALATLALVEQRNSNNKTALQLAEQAIKYNPSIQNGYILKGDLLAQQGNYKAALASYRDAEKYLKSSSLVIRQYRIRNKLGQFKQAERTLISWLNNNPDDDQIRLILASFYQMQNQIAKAIREYELLLQQHPDNVVVLNNLALAYHSANDSRAVDYARKAYAQAPKSPQVSDTYGWLLVQNGEAEKGLTYIQQALNSEPDNPSIKFHIASAYVKLGNNNKARKILADILSTNESFDDRKAAQDLYRQL